MIRVFQKSFFLLFWFQLSLGCKHLFQCLSTALEEPGAHCGKQRNGSLYGLTSMTPHTIAYVAVQVYYHFSFHQHLTYDACFAMSSTCTWANINGPFCYSDFYWKIVGLLKDEEEAAALIKFYNWYVAIFLSYWSFSFCVGTYLGCYQTWVT